MHPHNKYSIPKGYNTTRLILRSLRYFRRSTIKAITINMEKFGDTYSVVFPGNRLIIVTRDLSFIQHTLRDNHTNYHKSRFMVAKIGKLFGNGLLFSSGSYWLQQRRLIQPGFHMKKLQGLYTIMVERIEQALDSFPAGAGVNVYPAVYQLAFTTLLRSLFDIDLSQETKQEISMLFNGMQDFVVKDMNRPFRYLSYVFTHEDKINMRRRDRLRSIIHAIIEQRRQDPHPYHDLLDMLLNARYEDTGEAMSDDQIIDEVLVLLLAGHETTANTLCWMLSMVVKEPQVLDKLRSVAETTGIYDSVRNDYINAVINESMRLRPAAFMTDRMALADDGIGQWAFPKDTVVIPFFYGVHRSKDHWDDPDAFVPERFLDEEGKLKKMPAFFPFGAGPRLCIGNNFAMAEMCFFVHAFFRRYTISSTGQEPVMKPLITLRPDKVVLNVRRTTTLL
ncbi:MAG TPA: cytochrome P450 [Puia sp.]|nr:cytochrome P450 [Puia sp.]